MSKSPAGRVLGDVLLHWLVRYVAGPGLLATAGLHQSRRAKVGSVVSGLLIFEGANVFSGRRSRRDERRRKRALEAKHVEEALRHITEVLIDAVTVFEARRPLNTGRYRANVMLVDGDVLRMAYKTPGYSAEEEALEWRRGEGCAGVAWARRETTLAPSDKCALPEVAEAHDPERTGGMTSAQVLRTSEVKAVVSVPIFSSAGPSEVVALFNLDDNLSPTDDGRPIFDAAAGVAARVGQWLDDTKLEFPATPRTSPEVFVS